MTDYKYICKADCPELDLNNEPHCKCTDLNQQYEYYPDGCPVGNYAKWEEIFDKPYNMILNGVKEYAEEYPVELMLDIETNRYCVVALNEGGHNSVCIDAEQLYCTLKEFFKNIHKGDD